jgi:hypothetical protein
MKINAASGLGRRFNFGRSMLAKPPNRKRAAEYLVAVVANDGCRIVWEHAGHRQQVADSAVHHPEERNDGGLNSTPLR